MTILRRPRLGGLIWAGCSVIFLAGCISVGNPDVANDSTIARIRVGETSKQQVLALLGQPADRRSIALADAGREWWAYHYATAVINPLEYLLLYGFLTNGIGAFDTRYDLNLFFDHRGIVHALSVTTTTYEMGGPATSVVVSSTADQTIGSAGPAGGSVRFVDKVEYRGE
jgi:hypothetical protein